MVKIHTLTYKDKDYLVADIPDVFTNEERRVLIGAHSLNKILYDDEKGYHDKTAEEIDEQIYAYLDDNLFSLGEIDFLSKVKELLD
ncbi:MAG: hypothetical protein IKH01_14630 [Prevotella sp.]|nr:hypothetical protein [Prevotella sp.]